MPRPQPKLANLPAEQNVDPTAWSPIPPNADDQVAYRIRRTQVGKPQSMIVLSHGFIGTATHFYNGRTCKCDPNGCRACAAGNNPRWHGFLAVFNPINFQISILEVPKSTVHQVLHYRHDLTSFRGDTLTVERVPNKPNGRVHASLKPTTVQIDHLPPAPDVAACLERMWDHTQPTSKRSND